MESIGSKFFMQGANGDLVEVVMQEDYANNLVVPLDVQKPVFARKSTPAEFALRQSLASGSQGDHLKNQNVSKSTNKPDPTKQSQIAATNSNSDQIMDDDCEINLSGTSKEKTTSKGKGKASKSRVKAPKPIDSLSAADKKGAFFVILCTLFTCFSFLALDDIQTKMRVAAYERKLERDRIGVARYLLQI